MEPKTERIELSGPEQEAIAFRIQACNRRITDLDDLSGGGSGTAIQVADRRFIATAAHVIESNHRFRLAVRPGAPQAGKIVKKAFDQDADIGLLEIDPGDEATDGRYADVSALIPNYDQETFRDVVIAGFPGELLEGLRPRGILATASLINSETVLPKDWPTMDSDRPLDKNTDILVTYPVEINYQQLGRDKHLTRANVKERPATKPHGLSGGGVWLNGISVSRDSGVVVPSPRLAGIQVSFFGGPRLLRATRIGQWIRLLLSEYPDLRGDLERLLA